jgi:hypothetical protein
LGFILEDAAERRGLQGPYPFLQELPKRRTADPLKLMLFGIDGTQALAGFGLGSVHRLRKVLEKSH